MKLFDNVVPFNQASKEINSQQSSGLFSKTERNNKQVISVYLSLIYNNLVQQNNTKKEKESLCKELKVAIGVLNESRTKNCLSTLERKKYLDDFGKSYNTLIEELKSEKQAHFSPL
ncbi:MAG: hypothetical protein LEGION0398_MBIBDBAK_00579 [Legionellaceae bacterium]